MLIKEGFLRKQTDSLTKRLVKRKKGWPKGGGETLNGKPLCMLTN